MPFHRHTFAELRKTASLALPIIAGSLSQILIGLTDSAMIGHVGRVPLAAAAFAGSVFGFFFIVSLGLLSPVSVFVARARGTGRPEDCALWLRHGVALGLINGVVLAVVLCGLSTQLHRLGQPPEVVAAVNPFFVIIAASFIPTMAFQALRQFCEAMGRPWFPMLILFGSVALNAFLNWVFIFGHLGCPALGLTGSGCASLVARTSCVVCLWIWLRRQPGLARLLPRWRDLRSVAWPHFREMFGIGVPVAGQYFFEVGAFSIAALLMGRLGTVPLAAHQIAISCASFTFMFPLGLSMASSIRLSQALGAGRRETLRPIGLGALGLAVAIMGAFALVFVAAGEPISRGFTSDTEVAALAARLLLVASLFQIFDGTQVVSAGSLRGLADVKIPTAITFVAYWVVALPSAWLLAFRLGFGPMGVWTGLALGLACAALLLAWRLVRATAMHSPVLSSVR